MVNKVFAGLVIAFWAGMMTALVRVEVFPTTTALQSYSTDRVLKKVFSNPEPVRLNVYYNDNHIGFFKISIEPPKVASSAIGESAAGADEDSYKVTSELRVWLMTFGMPSQLFLKGESIFNKNLELQRFNFVTTIGDRRVGEGRVSDGHIDITGDNLSKKVKVNLDVAGFRDERTLDFDQIKGAGLASAFGLPVMANFSFLDGGLANSFPAAGGIHSLPSTTTYRDRLEVAGNLQRVYLVDSKINDETWTKLWVDDAGQVLKVTTSLGLEMRSDMALGTGETGDPMNRGMRRHHRLD